MMQRLRRLLNVVVLALVAIVVWNEWRSRQRAAAVTPSRSRQPERVNAPTSGTGGPDVSDGQATAEPEGLVLPSPLGTPSAEEADDESLPAVGRAPAVESSSEAIDTGSSTSSERVAPVSSSATSGPQSLQASPATGESAAPANSLAGDGTTDCPESHPIKGNASSMIYHEPGRSSYARTIPEFCFATPEDAEAAGYRAAQR